MTLVDCAMPGITIHHRTVGGQCCVVATVSGLALVRLPLLLLGRCELPTVLFGVVCARGTHWTGYFSASTSRRNTSACNSLLTHVEMGSSRFNVLPSRSFRRVEIFGKVLLSHAEVLIFKLLDPSFKSPILISELNQLCVYLINGCNFRSDIHKSTSSAKLAIFCIALLHDGLNLS